MVNPCRWIVLETRVGRPNSTGDSGRQARGQAVAGEVGGQERHDLGHAPVLDGEDVEPARYVGAGGVVPQVGAECELAVCRCRQEPPPRP
jgi:hypothetical protein